MRCLRLKHLGQLATTLFIVLLGTSCLALMDPVLLWVAMAMMMAVVTCTRTPFLRVWMIMKMKLTKPKTVSFLKILLAQDRAP